MHHNDSLLLQFVLNELLSVADILSRKPSCLLLLGNPTSHWHFQRGRLYKLQTYYTQFSKETKDPVNKNIELLIRAANQSEYDSQTIKELQKQLRKISTQIFDKMVQFYDENILYFVLKRQGEIDLLHGSKWVSKFFKILFPEQDPATWISQKYAQRGFKEISPLIFDGFARLGQ